MTPVAEQLEPLVGQFITRVFGREAELVRLDRLSGGASQETYRVATMVAGQDRTFALRRAAGGRPHDEKSPHPGLEVEAELFSLARAAGIPEPEIFAVLEPSDGLGPGFLLEWLDGETLGPRIVRSDDFAKIRPKLARQCGEVLGRIHSLEVNADLEQRLLHQTPEQFVHDMWSRYQALETVQPMIDYTALWLLEHLPRDTEPKLVHNDFRNGNLMISKDQGIIAVLDWELAHLGDPMRDLGWICCNSWRFGGSLPVGGFGSREDLFAGYESVTGQPVDPNRVLWWEVFGSFWWAVSTLGMAQHNRSGPDPSVERVAVGRRTSECQMDCVNLLFPGPFVLEQPDPEPTDLAHHTELLGAVSHFLKTEVLPGTKGRLSFLSRVSANTIDVVVREAALNGAHVAAESDRLQALGFKAPSSNDAGNDSASDITAQRSALIEALKNDTVALSNLELQEHLRQTVAQQLAIDQPKYSALKWTPQS